MSIADRYGCQLHGTDKHEDCIACEVYGDIAELVERIAELEQQLADCKEKAENAALEAGKVEKSLLLQVRLRGERMEALGRSLKRMSREAYRKYENLFDDNGKVRKESPNRQEPEPHT